MEPSEKFAVNLRQRRKARDLSQEELGARSDLHTTEISRLERGKREPRLSTMVRLARALGIPVSDLVSGID